MRAFLRAALLAMAGGLLLAAFAAQPAVAQTPPGEQGTVTLQPYVGDVKHPPAVTLRKGDAIAWDWEVLGPAGATLRFTAHQHLGAQLVNLTAVNATRSQDRVVLERDGLYSLIWENRDNDSAVTFRYSFEFVAAPTQKPAPFPAWASVAALAAAALVASAAARRR